MDTPNTNRLLGEATGHFTWKSTYRGLFSGTLSATV